VSTNRPAPLPPAQDGPPGQRRRSWLADQDARTRPASLRIGESRWPRWVPVMPPVCTG